MNNIRVLYVHVSGAMPSVHAVFVPSSYAENDQAKLAIDIIVQHYASVSRAACEVHTLRDAVLVPSNSTDELAGGSYIGYIQSWPKWKAQHFKSNTMR